MGTAISLNSPEPDARTPSERAFYILGQKPLRMAQMLRLSRIINDATPEEKLAFYEGGILKKICSMIDECSNIVPASEGTPSSARQQPGIKQSRRKASSLPNIRGVGYGFGTTKSRWDMEKTVEERLIREERLVWLLNAVTAYLYCASPDFGDPESILQKVDEHSTIHVVEGVVQLIRNTAVIPLLEYHLHNESVFDISENMELYQALLEAACSMALYPDLLETLIYPQKKSRSIVVDLMPKFREVVEGYMSTPQGPIGSPDFRLVDFIQKVQRWAELLETATNFYFPDLDQANLNEDLASLGSATASIQNAADEGKAESADPKPGKSRSSTVDRHLAYINALKPYQVTTWKFIGDYGKLVVPYAFKKEAKNLNPFSPAMKDRTKRIAKEIASLHSSLPISQSNSIFICIDEGRCDIMKVLITGPDETPYQNGCFEFDIFFPSSYPFSPPKISFLTTGGGSVRFNPNLYNDGKVCLSILGTWEGRPEEKWNPYCSLLQVLISIQGLIFVKDPYFNEPGFEKYMGTSRGVEFSKRYNHQIEHASLHYAIRDQLRNPSEHFKTVIQRHFWQKRGQVIEQAQRWLAEVNKEIVALAAAGKNDNASSLQAMELFDFGFTTLKNMEKTVEALTDDLLAMTPPSD